MAGTRLRSRAALLAGLAAGAACATPIDLPPEFVELRDPGSGYRATTADDARLWVRSWYERTPADVAFWAESLGQQLVERGHRLAGEGEIQDSEGATGRWLELTGNVRGARTGYLVAVFRRDPSWLRFWDRGNWLQVVEFAAEQEVFAARVEAVRAALRTIRW